MAALTPAKTAASPRRAGRPSAARGAADQPIPRPAVAARQGRAADHARAAPRPRGQARVAGQAGRERPARGPAPRARPGPVRSWCCSARPATSPTARSSRRSTSCGGRTCCRTSSCSWPIGRRPYDDETFRAEIRASLEQFSRVLPVDEAAWRSFAERICYQRLDFDDPDGFDAPRDRASTSSTRSTAPAATGSSTSPPSRRSSPRSSASSAGSGSTTSTTTAAGGGSSSRSRSATTSTRRSGSTARSARSSASRRSTASTTTWARRPSATCWSSASATASSSRSGTGATSTTCRSRWPSRSASRTAARSTRRPARRATSSRTTCSSWSASSRWSRRRPSRPTRCATRRSRSCARSRSSPASVATDVVRGQYGPGWVAATKVPGYREEPEVDPQSETETFVAARLDDRRLALVRRARSTSGPASACPKRATEIAIQYREVPHRLFRTPRVEPDAEPAGHPDPAGRGDHAALRGQGPGPRARRPLGDDGLHLRLGVQRRLARRLRDADPRRAAGRRLAVHPRRRGRGGVEHRRPDHRRLGRPARRPTSRTTTPGRGDRPRPTSCSPATADAGAGSEARARWPTTPGQGRASPSCAGRRAPHSIAEIESELARIWASQDLTADVDGEPGRHIAARTSVMNLVVVARRPELAERCAATIQALTGRHPSRTIIIQLGRPGRPVVARRAGRGALRAAARGRAGDLRRDDPRDLRRRVRAGTWRRSRRRSIIHDLPVTVWWPGEPPLEPARRARPAATARTGSSSTARPGAATASTGCASWPRCQATTSTRDQRLRARPPVALARGDRLDLRRPGLPALPALAAADRGHLRDPRRDRRARLDEPGQAGLPRRLARLAARACPWSSRSPRSSGTAALAAASRPVARSAAAKPVIGRGLAATLSDGRGGGRRRRPADRLDDAAGDDAAGRAAGRAPRLRAAGRRDRRGRDRPRPRLAGRRRGARPALPRPAADRGRPAGRGDRDPAGATRSRSAPCARPPRSIGDRRLTWRDDARARDRGRRRSRRPAAIAGGRADRRDADRRGRPRAAAPTGRRPAARRRSGSTGGLVRPPLRDAVPWPDVHVWWGDDRYVPRDHPLSNVKPLDDILLGIGRTEEGTAGGAAGRPAPGRRTSTRSRRARRSAAARGAAWCAAALADELRAAGRPAVDGWPVFDLLLLGIGRRRPPAVGLPGLGRARRRRAGAGRSRRRPTSSRTSSGSRSIRRSSAPPGASSWSRPAPARRRSSAEVFGADARPAPLAGPARPARAARPGSSTSAAAAEPPALTGELAGAASRRAGSRLADGTPIARLHERRPGRRWSSSTARPPTTRRSGSSARCWPLVRPSTPSTGAAAARRATRPPYAIEREFEDVAAVAGRIAAETGAAGRRRRPLVRRPLRARRGAPDRRRSAGSSATRARPRRPASSYQPAGLEARLRAPARRRRPRRRCSPTFLTRGRRDDRRPSSPPTGPTRSGRSARPRPRTILRELEAEADPGRVARARSARSASRSSRSSAARACRSSATRRSPSTRGWPTAGSSIIAAPPRRPPHPSRPRSSRPSAVPRLTADPADAAAAMRD